MAAKRVLSYLQGTMNSEDRKSTSGGVLRLQGLLLHTWSETQSVVAQSSCEAELLALNMGAVEGKLM
eukprot:1116164-Heterocapsa_arctica.AAC.1